MGTAAAAETRGCRLRRRVKPRNVRIVLVDASPTPVILRDRILAKSIRVKLVRPDLATRELPRATVTLVAGALADQKLIAARDEAASLAEAVAA